MSSRKARVSAPRAVFLVCEDVRVERGDKLSLMGCYLGEKILVSRAANAPALPPGVVAILDRLALVATMFDVRSSTRTVPASIELLAPSGKSLMKADLGVADLSKGSATVALGTNQLRIPEFGAYTARFQVGQHVLEFSFSVEEASAAADLAQ